MTQLYKLILSLFISGKSYLPKFDVLNRRVLFI